MHAFELHSVSFPMMLFWDRHKVMSLLR